MHSPVRRRLLSCLVILGFVAPLAAGCGNERAATAPNNRLAHATGGATKTGPPPARGSDPKAKANKHTTARLTMRISWCRAAGCDLEFNFDKPMVAKEDLATAAPLPIQLEPAQRGAWAWASDKQLVFRPADGQLLNGWKVVARLDRATALSGETLARPFQQTIWVPDLELGNKWASWTIEEGKPRFVGVFYDTQARMGKAPIIVLYDQPVDPSAIHRAGLTVVDKAGKELELRVSRPLNAKPFWDGPMDPRLLVAVEAMPLPAHGAEVVLHAPTLTKKGERTISKRRLEVVDALTIATVEPPLDRQKRMSLSGTWWIRTSAAVDPKSARKHISIRPRPKRVDVSADGDWITVSGAYEPGRTYTLTVDKGLTDLYGNVLATSRSHTARTADHAPRVSVPRSGLVVERRRPQVPVRVRNVRDVEVRAYRFERPHQFIAGLAAGEKTECRHYGAEMDLLGVKRVAAPGAINEEKTADILLPTRGAAILACVEVRGHGLGSKANPRAEPSWATLVQVTDLGVLGKVSDGNVLTWTTALSTGTPLRARVQLVDVAGKVHATSRAGADGVANLAAAVSGTSRLGAFALIVTRRNDRAVLRLRNDRLAQPWQFGLRGSVAGAEQLAAAVFTERGAYRPGETVHAKAIVRDPASFGPPKNRRATLTVTDSRGKKLLNREVALDGVGGVHVELPLAKGAQAPTGTYTVRVQQGQASASHRFRVEEYRVPTFAVNISDEGKPWRVGRKQAAVITAAYLSGGALAAREVKYQVTRADKPFKASAYSGFVFGRHDATPRADTVLAGTKKLNGQGKLVLDFPVSGGSPNGPSVFEVRASVTDVDRQVYAGELRRTVHTAARYVGLKAPRRSVVRADSVLQVPVVVVDAKGRAVSGEKVVVVAQRLDAHSAARKSGEGVEQVHHEVATAVTRCSLVTGPQPKVCRVRLPHAGRYRVLAKRLGVGVSVPASTAMVATGGRPAAWPRFEHERIAITRDKPAYDVGETAKLVVANPFAEVTVRALLTLERDGVLEHRVIEIPPGTPSIDVAVRPEHAPNVFASVALVRGRIGAEAGGAARDVRGPRFRIGYASIKVRPTDALARIDVIPSHERVAPGATVDIDLHALDRHGKGITGSATVAVVDEAVLKLTGYDTPDLMAQLFTPRPLAVRTAENRLETASARRDRHAAIFPGGDGEESDEEGDGEDANAEDDTSSDCDLLVGTRGRRVRCPKDPIADHKARSEKESLKVRSNFASTAYWNPDVPISDGRGRVSVKLPDNDTTWRVMVVAADAAGRFGSSEAKVVARKPVLVQPVVPRFVFPGDTLVLGALVKNGTDAAGDAVVQVELQAATSDGDARRALKKVVKAGRQALVEFPVEVPMVASGEVRLQLNVDLGGHRDATVVTIPVLNPTVSRTTVKTRQIVSGGAIDLQLPAGRIAGSDALEVVVSSNGLAALKESVDYIMQYPHGCIEQTTSGATPLLVLKDLLPEMGVDVDMAKLRTFAAAGVKRLLSFQTTKGGLSYWPGEDKPHAFGTAFALTALIEARKQGYDVPASALARMADYLETQLHAGAVSESMPHGGMADGDTKALFAMTLGRLGREQTTSIDKLWAARQKLTPFGLAFLGVAATESKHRHHLADPILAAVSQAARQSATEQWYEGRSARGWSMGSPLRTHAGALLAWAGAYPKGETTGKLLRGLVGRARNGRWGNTQENVFGMMAVAALAKSQEAAQGPAAELSLNGRPVDLSTLEPLGATGRARRLRLTAGQFGLPEAGQAGTLAVSLKNRAATPLTLTVRSAYQASLSPATMKARAAGFKVTRRYETVDGKALGATLGLGDVIRIKVKVKADLAAHYVAIDDRLPAGLEPLNTQLKTTERVTKGTITDAGARGLKVLSYSEIRDARVSFYADEMPKGTYEFSYLARATTAGDFLRPAATAEAMYAPEVHGATPIDRVVIR